MAPIIIGKITAGRSVNVAETMTIINDERADADKDKTEKRDGKDTTIATVVTVVRREK